jgi:hypothetical protein
MKAFLEITEWDIEVAVPNHVYFLNDSKDKMYGYVQSGTGIMQTMKTPYRFYTRGRKFKEVPNTWNFKIGEDEPKVAPGKQYRVPGSKGSIYTVTNDAGSWSCTCPASKWQKGECKHIKSLLESSL